MNAAPRRLARAALFAAALAASLGAGPSPSNEEEAPPVVIPLRVADLAAPATERLTIDLAGAVERAGRDNLALRLSAARAAEAEGERASARAYPWPEVGVGALARHTDGRLQGTFGDLGTATFDTALANAIVRWDLNPGAAHFRNRAAGRSVEASRSGVAVAREQAGHDAATQYLELVGAAALASVARETRDEARTFLRMAEVLEEKGLGPGADVQRARAEVARRTQALTAAEEAFRLASARLAETLAVDPATWVIPTDDAIREPELPGTKGADALATRALTARPEARRAEEELEAARAAVEVLHWETWGPGLTLEAQRGTLGRGFSDTAGQSILGARLAWTFRPSEIGAVHAARARLDAARVNVETTHLRIRTEVVAAREKLEAARKRLPSAREALDASERALHISQTRFTGGLGNALEVLQAQEALAGARAEAVEILVEAHESIYDLRRALGEPLGAP